jgi:hypothetical protein
MLEVALLRSDWRVSGREAIELLRRGTIRIQCCRLLDLLMAAGLAKKPTQPGLLGGRSADA